MAGCLSQRPEKRGTAFARVRTDRYIHTGSKAAFRRFLCLMLSAVGRLQHVSPFSIYFDCNMSNNNAGRSCVR